MLSKFVTFLGGNPHKREVEKLSDVVTRVNALEADFEKLSDDA